MSVKTIKYDIDSPIKMNSEIEYNQLTLMTGPNGVGKSFHLVTVYVMSTIGATCNRPEMMDGGTVRAAQYIVDHCYSGKVNGTITMTMSDDNEVTLVAEQGVVTAVNHSIADGTSIPPSRYMSSAMRTFDAMSNYLTVRKLTGNIEKTAESFKMYDVMHIETMIHQCPKEISEENLVHLKSMGIEDDIISMDVDLEKCDFYLILKDGKKKYCKEYSAGNQSILNMFINQF